MVRWMLKWCPRCLGDLFVGKGEYGRYENCPQCGYVRYPEPVAEVGVRNSAVSTKLVAAERES
jgi:ssDNA-binding Zn-finger/Zn-ribbon topoisomerase 1